METMTVRASSAANSLREPRHAGGASFSNCGSALMNG